MVAYVYVYIVQAVRVHVVDLLKADVTLSLCGNSQSHNSIIVVKMQSWKQLSMV